MNTLIRILFVALFFVGSGMSIASSQETLSDRFFNSLTDQTLNQNSSSGIPLYDINSQLIGQVVSNTIDGRPCELIFTNGQLTAFGMGGFLTIAFTQSVEVMEKTLTSRYGDQAKLIDRHLTMIHPLMFVIQGIYNYQGKIIHDLILKCNSFIFTLKGDDDSSSERRVSINQPVLPFDYRRVSFEIPIYQYYLSDFSTCVLMLANYWRHVGWIKTQLHPEDSRYFLVNLHLMMYDVEMLRRKCRCENDSKSIAEIIASFIKARGEEVKVEVLEANHSSPEKNTFQIIKDMIRRTDQPYLIEISSKNGYSTYAILTGYAQIPKGEFLECVFPTPFLGEKTYQRYFFKWNEGYDVLKIYQIIDRSGSENL